MRAEWDICQSHSDEILAEGLFTLRSVAPVPFDEVESEGAGNYVISLHNAPDYTGEALNLRSRLARQFNPRTSTFYKSFKDVVPGVDTPIEAFRVQCVETAIGRKELEEFGIVNIPTHLNKQHVGKRDKVERVQTDWLWLEVQGSREALLRQGEQALFDQPGKPWREAPEAHCPGVYQLRSPEFEGIVYIGESADIGKRIQAHGRDTYFSALRRNIGRTILGFTLRTIKGKRRHFSPQEDAEVDAFLNDCRVSILPVDFGRVELEEHLIAEHRPLLNRKGRTRAPVGVA